MSRQDQPLVGTFLIIIAFLVAALMKQSIVTAAIVVPVIVCGCILLVLSTDYFANKS